MTVTTEPITGTYVADPAHSTFQFTVTHMKVFRFTATFDDVAARVVAGADGVHLDGAVQVESISIRSPREFRDHVLYGADFFDARNHPEMTFRSAEVELDPDGAVTLRGELTIKGVARPFVATGSYQPPVEDPFGGTRAAVELSAAVDRREWGLTWQTPMPRGGDALGWDVTLTAYVELIKQD